MKRIQFGALLFVLCWIGQAVAQEAAVVEINTFLPSGSVKQGTGFFFREDPSILTAYHVIEGAKGINVILQNEAGSYSDVMVEFISTKYDIAMIYLPELKNSTAYLPLADPQHIPPPDEPLTVVGNPRMGMQQKFRTYPTTANFINSKTFLDNIGSPIFNESIDVIPIDLTNYVGMSGAPVISTQGVIGVFSGSYGEGGALGWLIPRKYFGSLKKIHKRPNEIQHWPTLTLMGTGFKDLRRSLNLNPQASSLIRSYLNDVEVLAGIYDRLTNTAAQLQADSEVNLMIIASIPPNQPTIAPLEPLHEEVSNHLQAFMEANNSYSRICNSIVRRLNDLGVWFDKESGLSFEKKLRLTQGIDQITSRYSKVANQDYYSAIGITEKERQEFINVVSRGFGAETDAEKLAAVRNFFNVLARQMPHYHSFEANEYVSKDITRYRAYSKLFMEFAE